MNDLENPGLDENCSVQLVVDDKTLGIYKDVASRHGMTVTVLNKEGEYTTSEGYTGTLRDGKKYIKLSAPQPDLSAFWSEVDMKKERG